MSQQFDISPANLARLLRFKVFTQTGGTASVPANIPTPIVGLPSLDAAALPFTLADIDTYGLNILLFWNVQLSISSNAATYVQAWPGAIEQGDPRTSIVAVPAGSGVSAGAMGAALLTGQPIVFGKFNFYVFSPDAFTVEQAVTSAVVLGPSYTEY